MAKLEKMVRGSLLCAINDHGPITKDNVGSAVKRVCGQLRSGNGWRDIPDKPGLWFFKPKGSKSVTFEQVTEYMTIYRPSMGDGGGYDPVNSLCGPGKWFDGRWYGPIEEPPEE